MPSSLSRRRLLGLGGALAGHRRDRLLGVRTGIGPVGAGERDLRAARDALDSHRSLAGLPLVYEVNGRRTAFRFDGAVLRPAGVLGGLAWSRCSRPGRRSCGPTAAGPTVGSACDSWHNSGRAFDVARLPLADGSVVSCRYDQWRDPRRGPAGRRPSALLVAGRGSAPALRLRAHLPVQRPARQSHPRGQRPLGQRRLDVQLAVAGPGAGGPGALQLPVGHPGRAHRGRGTPPPGRRPARCWTGSGSTTPWTLAGSWSGFLAASAAGRD